LPYSEAYQMNMSLGAVASQNFRLNSVFDPDITGSGHQPRWFDQYSALYASYVVVASKIEVSLGPAAADNCYLLTYLDGSGLGSVPSMGGSTLVQNSELPGTTFDISVSNARTVNRHECQHGPPLGGWMH
jgi:hypothetical protein